VSNLDQTNERLGNSIHCMKIPISHFPWESKKHTGMWDVDRYFPLEKYYNKSVVARCCTLRLWYISVSESGLRFILSPNSVCICIKLHLCEIPDIDVLVCSRTYRYFEIKLSWGSVPNYKISDSFWQNKNISINRWH
jgi:hypothetical protein